MSDFIYKAVDSSGNYIVQSDKEEPDEECQPCIERRTIGHQAMGANHNVVIQRARPTFDWTIPLDVGDEDSSTFSSCPTLFTL